MPDVIVVDGFYEVPDRVRQFALTSEWLATDALQREFPGTESRKCFFSSSLVNRFSDLVGAPITVDPTHNSFGAFALTLAKDNVKKIIHVDGCKWAGIVFLTPDTHSSGGTNLYKHKLTGLCRYPTELDAKQHGFGSSELFYNEILAPSASIESDWEIDISIEMRFNRLVLFKGGERFHAPDHYFGTSAENGRLVQLFFFGDAPRVL